MSTKMNKFTTRMIISIAIIIIATMFPNVSLGWNLGLGSEITVGMDVTTWEGKKMNNYTLANTNGLYCIQRGATINSNETNRFQVVGKVSIVGKNAEYTYKSNGNTVTKSSSNWRNAKMSYILSGGDWTKQYGSKHKTYYPRQVAIYKYWNTWVKNSGLGLGGYSYSANNDKGIEQASANKIISAAENYANGKNSEYKPVQLKMTTSSSLSVTGTTIGQKIGPFKATYTGNAIVTAYDAKGNKISKIEIYNASGKKINTIPNGSNFYIKNNSNSEIAKLDIEVTSKVLKTDIYILKCIGGAQVQRIIAVNSSTTNQTATATINVKVTPTGNLTVIKKDKETSSNLAGMEFKIRTSKGWLQQSNGKYIYNASFANATTFKLTSESGNTIKNLLTSVKYQVWETKTPSEEYILSEQDNYNSTYKAVNLTGNERWITLTQNKTRAVTYDNTPMVKVSISGYVWVDAKQKDDENDSLYNEGETKLAGVTVNLKTKSGETVATVTTDSEGKYIFKEMVRSSQLSNYYVEFDYSTTSDGAYTQYIPVAYNSANIDQIVANGSRALAEEIAYEDENLIGIASTYKGSDQEKVYGLTGILYDKLYNSNNYTLENINLGIKPIYDPDYTITEYLDYVKINMNGYEYTYKYGEKAAIQTKTTAIPTVNFGDKTDVTLYTRDFYPSDIAYNEKNPQSLQVYVVYGIAIKNTTTYNKQYDYMEKQLCVTNLSNTFDSSRYTLEATGEFASWKSMSESEAVYTGDTITIGANQASTQYIQFKVKNEAISEILNNEVTIEKNPTTANAKAYHEYRRKDFSWKNNIEEEQQHRTKSKDRVSSAPYLLFRLGDSRRIQGTVFEDSITVTSDGQSLGDGIYNSSNEYSVDGVKVELLYENKNTAHVYPLPQGGDIQSIGKEAITYTSGNGRFEIKDIVPGKYYLRFTYPNGDTKLYNSNGNEITLDKYKSTIVTSTVAKNALKDMESAQHGGEWYKHLEGTNYSIAVDDMPTRAKYNSGMDIKEMKAESALIDITLENTGENIIEDANNVHYSLFEGFNFGVVTQPKQSVDVDKIITNVKLVNEPNIIFDGNPESDKLPGVTDLDQIGNNGGSTYTRAEVPEESLYGSTLTVSYEIKVTNTSNVNYYETDEEHLGWYYMFGEIGEYSNAVKINVDNVADYLDPVLTYSNSNMNVVEAVDSEGNKYLSITELGILAREETKTVKLEAYKVLSTQDAEMNFENDATVLEMKNVTEEVHKDNIYAQRSVTLVIQPEKPETSETEIVVTPPTGANALEVIMYVVTGIVMLGVLSAGVIIIKKKVL